MSSLPHWQPPLVPKPTPRRVAAGGMRTFFGWAVALMRFLYDRIATTMAALALLSYALFAKSRLDFFSLVLIASPLGVGFLLLVGDQPDAGRAAAIAAP